MMTVLINGIDSLLATRVAQLLGDQRETKLIGVGRRPPPAPAGCADILTADLTGQQMAELLRAEQVTVVLHLGFVGEEQPAPDREAAVQHNVLGSMELLGACAAAGIERVVLRSSTLVYGASHHHPAFITEAQPVTQAKTSGLVRDYIECDSFAHAFAEQHPDLAVAILRCAHLVGGGVSSPLVRYLTQPHPRTLFGFDPRLQVVHPDDAAAAFVCAATHPLTGAFNLAATDPIKLGQAIRLAGRQPLPIFEPVVDAATRLGIRPSLVGTWPFDQAFLRYSCVADTRRVQAELDWRPQQSAEQALRELRSAEDVAAPADAEAALQSFLSRRRET